MLAKLHQYFVQGTNKCTQLFHTLSHCYMFRHYRVILSELVINACQVTPVFRTMNQQMHTIISRIITPLHVSTLSCHPQTACNQYLTKLHQYFVQWTNKCTQLFHKLSHCYMFRHYRVILRQLVINTLPSYTSISTAAVGNTIYN